YLDGPSLFAALQVSRAWKCTLSPHIWTTISGVQWQHSTFPFRPTPQENVASPEQAATTTTSTSTDIVHVLNATTNQENGVVVAATTAAIQPNATVTAIATVPNEFLLRYQLGGIQILTWMDVRAARRQYPDKVPEENEDLPQERLVSILRMAIHLKSLTIQARRRGSYERIIVAIINRRGLDYLEIDLPHCSTVMILTPFYQVFAQLNGLVLRGHWYEVDDEMEEDEEDDEEVEQWGMRRLTTSRADLNLLRHCNRLEKLQLLRLVPQFAQEVPTLALLSKCPELQELELPPTADAEDMKGLESSLLMLTSLEKLFSFHLLYAEHAELLTTGREVQPLAEVAEEGEGHAEESPVAIEELSIEFALPALKELQIAVLHLTPQEESRFTSRLLQQRHLLERLILPNQSNAAIEALVDREWVCVGLKELRISIEAPANPEQSNLIWHAFYAQVRRLTRLEYLYITCQGMGKSTEDGIMLMQGATSLKRLTVGDLSGIWTQQEITNLARAAPGLEYLDLVGLSDDDFHQTTQWLETLGKPGILARGV
ncbi:hypothetical protein BGX33_000812, partial [Mortierella sp. NVP41]